MIIRGRTDKKGGLSAKSVQDLISILIQIIQYAEKKNYLAGFDYSIDKPKSKYNSLPVLTCTEQSKLVNYIRLTIDTEKLGILIALYTGIRLGELCALKWSDIDLQDGILKIQRIKDTDDNSSQKTKEIQEQTPQNAYILSGTAKHLEPRVYQSRFKRYLKEAQIEHINFHALRHTFATRAVALRVDVKSLSEILGHSSVRFTLERYVHSSHKMKKACIEKLSACY